MTPQFRLTEPAIRDIEQIADYIRHLRKTLTEQYWMWKVVKYF